MKRYCRKADAILCMTNAGKQDFIRYLNPDPGKIHVIPESYNEQCRVITDRQSLEAVRTKYRLPDSFILFVGGITPLKNIHTLVRAFHVLRNKDYPVKLVLAGFRRWKDRNEVADIERLGIRDDVIEPGFIDNADLPAVYNLADCFVLPSFYEGFGIPILEAQACGCPVIISDSGPMKEVSGGAALTFDPSNAEQLAAKISELHSDSSLRKRITGLGLDNVRKYSWEKTAKETIQVFENLAGIHNQPE